MIPSLRLASKAKAAKPRPKPSKKPSENPGSAPANPTSGGTPILLGCRLKLPPELEHEITHVDFDLPDTTQLGTVLDGILKSAKLKNLSETARESALQSALGLTTTEAENAFALSVVETKDIDPKIVAREKARTLKKNGLVEVVEATTSLDDIGGLGFITQRGNALADESVEIALQAA